MGVEAGIVVSAADSGCQVQLLENGVYVETRYSEPMIQHEVEVMPGDLVAIDRQVNPHRVIFRWALTEVERVQLRTDRQAGGQPLEVVDGLEVRLGCGDRVFAAVGKAWDLAEGGRPAHPHRWRTAYLPQIAERFGSASADVVETPAKGDATRGEVEYLTAETDRGRRAIQEVMERSYHVDLDETAPAWTRARVVDGVPVSFVSVDPTRELDYPGGSVRYAYIGDVATRTDRRLEGHFRALMEHVFASVREAGMPLVLLHGRYPLYRRFGFDVFTHHSGVFVTPEQIERTLGIQDAEQGRQLLMAEDRYLQEDLLLIVDVTAQTVHQAGLALQAAALLARERGKERILFEHPPVYSDGSWYRAYASLETPLTQVARTCGAQVSVQGADPEGGAIPDADWIKVLDAGELLRQVLGALDMPSLALPGGTLCLETDAGTVTLACQGGRAIALEGVHSAETVRWPSAALAQLVTGYRSAEMLSAIHDTPLSPGVLALLDALFPLRWRLSRNESWTYRH